MAFTIHYLDFTSRKIEVPALKYFHVGHTMNHIYIDLAIIIHIHHVMSIRKIPCKRTLPFCKTFTFPIGIECVERAVRSTEANTHNQ